MMYVWCLMENEEQSKHVPEMKLFEHVPAKEINSSPGESTAVMIIPTTAVTHKIPASLTSLQTAFSHTGQEVWCFIDIYLF